MLRDNPDHSHVPTAEHRSVRSKRLISRRQFLLAGGLGFVLAPAVGSRLALPTAAAGPSLTLDFASYGDCDGITNDKEAFARALSTLSSAGGGTLVLPPTAIAITMDALPTFDIPANVRIVGIPGATKLLLSSSDNDAFVAFAGSAGDNVTFDGIIFLRNANCTGFLFFPDGYNGFNVTNCIVDGHRDIYDKVFHGWVLHRVSETVKKNITITNTVVTRVVFGLLQGNTAAGDVDAIVVDNCDFTHNYGDDLEFNSPLGSMTNVLVSNCRFTDMQSTDLAASLGIGLAGVDGAVIENCYFEGTYTDAIHLEWGSSNVLIANNRFVGCANNNGETGNTVTELDRATITIMAQCHDVTVTGNTIDHRPNTNTIGLHAITVRNYTGGLSLAGDPCVPPWRITIVDNTIHCGEDFGGIWACDIADLTVRGNRIIGDGTVTAGASDYGNIHSGIRVDGINTVLADNAVSGFRFGITGPLAEDLNGVAGVSLPLSARRALGNPGTVSGNMVSDCYIGIVAVPAGATTLNNNILFNCVRPLVLGENAYPAEPCLVVGNFALGCSYPMEVGGKHIVQRSTGGSTVTVGSSKTVNVDETLLKMPVGTAITFSGGGVLTLTKAVETTQLFNPEHPYPLTGSVTGTNIGPNEYGITSALEHTTSSAPVFTSNNVDTASGP